MPPASQSPDTRRAARRGKKLLKRNLPPGLYAAAAAIAKDSPDVVRFWALAGSLACIALGLERAFLESGTLVRDLTWELHALLNGEPGKTPGEPYGFDDFTPWIAAQVEKQSGKRNETRAGSSQSGARSSGEQIRRMYFNWIDVANERLTFRRYARPDHIEHHARALLAKPLAFARALPAAAPNSVSGAVPDTAAASAGGFAEISEAQDALPSPTPEDIAFGVFALRFFDLLDVERQSTMGRNRIRVALASDVAGFYGVSEKVIPPTPGEETAAHETFLDEVDSLDDPDTNRVYRSILDDMATAVRHKLRTGAWPPAFRMRSPRERLPWTMRRRIGAGK